MLLLSHRMSLCALLLCASQVHAQILIGQTAGYTGTVALGVKETAEGAKMYFDMVNAKGGINGQKIELVSLDDKFDPKTAAENARVLIEEKQVLALFLTRGTPHTEAILPLLDKYSVALVAPSTGAMSLHQPVNKYVFNVRATYQYEAEKAIHYLGATGMIKRVALVATDDSFGADGLTGALKGLKSNGLVPVVNEKFDRSKPDFVNITAKIVAADAQAVMFIASGSAAASGIQALRAAGSGAQIITLSNNASIGFVKSLGANAPGVVVSQVFPSERSSSKAFVKEAQDIARSNPGRSIELTPSSLEGFAAAKVMVEALRRAGVAPTRAKIQAALEGIKEFDLGGMSLGYGPNDRTGLSYAELSVIGTDGKFRR